MVCGTGAQTDAYLNTDFTPDDQSERDALIAAQQAFNEECRQASGALLDHISTIEAIYDYDLARQLIGAEAELLRHQLRHLPRRRLRRVVPDED